MPCPYIKLKTTWHKIHFYLHAYRRLDIMHKSASLSFYTLFSIFPLVLVLVAFSSRFFSSEFLLNTITQFIQETLPYQSDLILQNLTVLVVKKRAFSWFGFVALVISAQALFVNFERIVNQLLHTSKHRNFIISRLLFLVWLIGIVFVLLSPVVFGIASSGIKQWAPSFYGLSRLFVGGGFVLVGFLVFWIVMLIMPTRRIHWKRVLAASCFFSVILYLGKIFFKWITLMHLDRYNLVYGSLASMILVGLWIYYVYNILLFFVYWAGREHDPVYHQKTLSSKF